MLHSFELVNVPEHTTLHFLAEQQAKERAEFAMAVSLLQSNDPDEVDTGRDLLERVQVNLANDLAYERQQLHRRLETTW